ncbi:hypothetical protein HID58_012391, partial [Brassica napus]
YSVHECIIWCRSHREIGYRECYIIKAMEDAFDGPNHGVLMEGINDIGGARIDLEGGSYLISRPLRFPSAGAGTLVVSISFCQTILNLSKASLQVELGTLGAALDDTHAVRKMMCLSLNCTRVRKPLLLLVNLLIDCNYRGGANAVINSLRTSIDNCYIIRFGHTNGILVQKGHETYIRNSFLGQHITAGGDRGERKYSGTAVNLIGNHNAITDTLDYTGIVAENPVQLQVSGTFFLGDVFILILLAICFPGRVMESRLFNWIRRVRRLRMLTKWSLTGTVTGMAMRSTVAKGSVDGNGTSWTVFNPVQCTLVAREGGGFLVHAVSRRDMTKLLEIQEKIQERLAVTPSLPPLSSPSSPFPKMVGRVIYPISYGADPTGGQDSSDAILEALTDAFQLQTELNMLPRVADLGGVVIDLQGGSYKIGKPLRFPSSGGGNLLVKGGTFRASEVFPGDRHLVELVTSMKMSLEDTFSDQKDQNSGIFFEDVTFKDVLFDSSFRGGGILVINSARIRITDCYFLHFTTQGIKVQGGHETYISNTFLGQHSTVGGDKQERQFSGTGIDISSTDNAITDVVIFSAGVGILLNGQANMVTGVHCYNKATWFGGIGILVKAHLTRIDNCYLDYTGIVIEDPVHVHVTNALFLGDANIVLRSVHGRINGVNIVNNMFSGDPKHNFPMVKLEGEFHEVGQVVIDQNNVEGMVLKSTTGRSKVSGNGTRWVADFSNVLLFPNRIEHYQHSFLAQSGQIPASAVTNVSNNVVVVETDRAVTGTVSVIVYQ